MPDEIQQEAQLPEADPTVGFDPRLLIAGKETTYTPNVIGLTPKDENGVRKLAVPITPTETLGIIIGPEHQEYLLKQLAGGIEVADLTDLAAAAEQAKQQEQQGG